MTTLQEAARDALEALERIGKDFVCRSAHHAKKDQHSAFAECPVVVRHTDAIESLKAALAQQGEQQPVCHGCGIPAGDVHMSTCKSGKWPSRVSNGDTAAPAPQTAPVAWVWNPASIEWEKVRAFGHWQQGALYAFGPTQPEPLAAPAPQAQDKSDNYLSGYCTGRTDLLKEQSAQLVTQPLAKTCDTCAHYQQGKHPGVSIHDETCYECRSYWGNKWEAA